MRKRTRIIVGLVLAAVAVFIAALVLLQPTPKLPITVSFLGHTNDTNGLRLAMFAVTNHSTVTVRRWGLFHPESRRQPGQLSTIHLGPNVFLQPKQSEVVSVPAPTNQEAWRLVLDFSRDGWRRKFSDWCGQGEGGLVDAVVPDRLRGIPCQLVRSEWIEP
jgi:hypothetical protein